MEPLWKLLGVTQGLTAVIGSGGKTSLLYELAEELRPCGTVLLATTTHIMKPPQYPFAETAEQLSAALAAEGVACAGSFTPEGKLTAPDFDGSRRRTSCWWKRTAPNACPPRRTRHGSQCCRPSGRGPSAWWEPRPSVSPSDRRPTVQPFSRGWQESAGARSSRRKWLPASSRRRGCAM